MEAEVLTKFLADLVNATSDCVQAISDQCLAKGLIIGSTYRKVLESGGTSEDKARTLILSIQSSTKTDGACFDILLEILDEQLPPASKQKLLLEMRKEREERANSCLALVPTAHSTQQSTDPTDIPLTVTSQQCVQQQSSLLSRYENSVSRLAYSSAEKKQFEEALQSRVEESRRLNDKLETLESQLEVNSLASEKDMSVTKRRILACETEMSKLKRKIEELEGIIEEESMQAKRGRNTIRIGTKRLFDQVVQQSQQEVKRVREELVKSKKQAEQEASIQRRKEEAKIRVLEHKLAAQEKELQIKASRELENAKIEQERRPIRTVSTQEVEISAISSVSSAETWSGVPAIGDLRRELYQVADKWEEIGMLLNISQEKLREIKLDIGAENKCMCLCEMLRFWLESSCGHPLPSWSAITEVFEVMGDGILAGRLRSKYCTILTKNNHAVLFEQLSNYANQWREIGTYLKFIQSELTRIESQYSLPWFVVDPQQPNSILDKMLYQWLQRYPGDSRGSNNYAILEDLKDALRLVGLTADDLHL